MQTKNIIIIVLLVCTIALGLFSILKKDNREILKGCQNPDKSHDKECIAMSKEGEWANAGDGMPKGWVEWEDIIEEVTVSAKGPVKYGASKMIITGDLDLVAKLQKTDSSVRCVGDLEITTCAIGTNPEVVRYWNVINYFY